MSPNDSANDPRVYSIAAYQTEIRQIEEEWQRTCRQNQWADLPLDSPDYAVYHTTEAQYEARLEDCRDRHFPGLAAGIVDSPAKLWASIHQHVRPTLSCLSRLDRAKALREALQRVRYLLLELKVPWAKEPPYPELNADDAENELLWIANQLEEDDAKRCRTGAPRDRGGAEPSGEPKPKPKRGRKPDTDPKEDKRITGAWRTGHYRTYEKCANALGTTAKKVKEAIDRHRHRKPGHRRRRSQAPE